MKLSKYINKYNYIDYYTKQKAFLFHTNTEIELSIKAIIYKYGINSIDSLQDEEEDQEEAQEIDALEYFKYLLETEQNVDLNNSKIIEGNILDQKSKFFIIEKYKEKIEKIYDFDVTKHYVQEEAFLKTINLIHENENIIIFQPTFINKNMITKCDALVKIGDNIKIIETKGTTTAKIIHFLDLFFQSKVLEIQELDEYFIDYSLCLVDYVSALKNECPFVITNFINYQKNVNINKIFSVEQKRMTKQGFGITLIGKDEYEEFPISIVRLIEYDFSELEEKRECAKSGATKKAIDSAIEKLIKVHSEFDDAIEELINIKNSYKEGDKLFIDNIIPSYNDKGDFKNSDIWPLLRQLYQIQGYELFNYSGNVVCQTGTDISNFKKGSDIVPFFKKDKYDLFLSDNNEILLNKDLLNSLFLNLKDKKVYFDFETMNTSIRTIDNSFPFMQIVTQCSIIKDNCDNTSYSEMKCNNIVIDPLFITINDFKKIIDSLYSGSEYSYVVYNKSFEKSRLNEMAIFINEKEYSDKVNIIVNNLFDLAEFFQIKKEGTPIIIKEFGGFYSIKKVLPYIEKKYKDLFILTDCKDYKKLIVSNGLDCQLKTSLRFFNKLSNKEWLELKKNIEIYCENDVRAMIAVELFVKKIVI